MGAQAGARVLSYNAQNRPPQPRMTRSECQLCREALILDGLCVGLSGQGSVRTAGLHWCSPWPWKIVGCIPPPPKATPFQGSPYVGR